MQLLRILLIPILLIRFAGVAPAREQEPNLNSGILIRGFAVELINDIEKVELREKDRLLVELELATGQLDAGKSIKAREFSFGITKDKAFVPMGSISLPDFGRNFILVFIPAKDRYRVHAVRADDPEFKANEALLFNFTPHRIHAELGTDKQAIDSEESARLSPGFETDALSYPARFSYEPENGKILPFSNTRWRVNANLKTIVFVTMAAGTNTPAYRSVVLTEATNGSKARTGKPLR